MTPSTRVGRLARVRTSRASRRGARPSDGSRPASSTAAAARRRPTPARCCRRSRAASAWAAPSRSTGACTLRTSPPSSASSGENTRPVATHSIAWLIPTMRGRNQLEAASGTIPRRAKTKPIFAPSATRRMSIGSVIVMPTPTAGTVDRRDHGLGRVEDAQRDQAAAVARDLARLLAVAPVEGVAAAAEVGAGAEASPLAGDDDGPHLVVGVGAVERLEQLPAHRRRERVQPIGPVERDGQYADPRSRSGSPRSPCVGSLPVECEVRHGS